MWLTSALDFYEKKSLKWIINEPLRQSVSLVLVSRLTWQSDFLRIYCYSLTVLKDLFIVFCLIMQFCTSGWSQMEFEITLITVKDNVKRCSWNKRYSKWTLRWCEFFNFPLQVPIQGDSIFYCCYLIVYYLLFVLNIHTVFFSCNRNIPVIIENTLSCHLKGILLVHTYVLAKSISCHVREMHPSLFIPNYLNFV